ncbi:MAG: hypothetical protein DI585_03090 [Pseudomonas fluorescens]|nr:MAG: hypothetical protein DI585_03090 [Pseudomonas fluorescens]
MANPHRLLIVEDTLTLMMELEELLLSAGYRLELAMSVPQATEALRKSTEENQLFAAIISDFNLGGLRPESMKTGINVFQYAYRILGKNMPPFIGSSTEMHYWEPFKNTKGIYLIPKKNFHWNEQAVLTQLKDLGLAA